MPDRNVATTLRAVAYKRRSQDSGTGVSEDIADTDIEAYASRKGFEVTTWLEPDLDASSWTLDRPRMQEALALARTGRVDAIVVAKLSRITRRPRDWHWLMEAMKEDAAKGIKWTILCADFDVDLSTPGGRMIAGIVMETLAFEYEEKLDGYNKARKNAVLKHGVHGGTTPPLGYSGWSVRGQDKKGNDQRGPLVVDKAAAARIRQAFEEFEAGASWNDVVAILGVKSQGNARSIFENRVYLGTAYSSGKHGTFEKPDAHKAIVPKPLFASVQRRLAENRRTSSYTVAGETREGALLGAKILHCGTCGRSLKRNQTPKGDIYRCNTPNSLCSARASVMASAIEPVVLFEAFKAHAVLNPLHISDLDDAARVVFAEKADKARAEVEKVRALQGSITPSAFAVALSDAETALSQAEALLTDAEASRGWLGMDTDTVQKRILTDDGSCKAGEPGFVKDIAQARDFIKQMVRVQVNPCGRGKRVKVEDRIEVVVLSPGAAQGLEVVEQAEDGRAKSEGKARAAQERQDALAEALVAGEAS